MLLVFQLLMVFGLLYTKLLVRFLTGDFSNFIQLLNPRKVINLSRFSLSNQIHELGAFACCSSKKNLIQFYFILSLLLISQKMLLHYVLSELLNIFTELWITIKGFTLRLTHLMRQSDINKHKVLDNSLTVKHMREAIINSTHNNKHRKK